MKYRYWTVLIIDFFGLVVFTMLEMGTLGLAVELSEPTLPASAQILLLLPKQSWAWQIGDVAWMS